VAVADDGDIVRELGFVTMYAAWVEEDVDDLLRMMHSIDAFDERKQRWPISRKLKHAADIVRTLKSAEVQALPDALDGAIDLFERRNEYVHGRIYAGFDRTDYIQGGRANTPTKPITSAELYALANEFWGYRGHFIGPQLFRLPRAIQKYHERAS
jgi:HAMP domain-containing protein